jgi:acetyl-CoA carboxylase biotin carboxyl carrier protein
MTRVSAASIAATLRERDLVCPMPGRFRPVLAVGDLVHDGTHLGDLDVLGRRSRVVAPGGAYGAITAIADGPVAFGTALATLDPTAVGATAAMSKTAKRADDPAAGRVFRAPTSGRFYGRSSPDKPAFVTAGAELVAGATICLLEVMKTFHRVTYAGEPARVKAVLVADGADVNAGDALLSFE